jgi:hypothetical protein
MGREVEVETLGPGGPVDEPVGRLRNMRHLVRDGNHPGAGTEAGR